MNFTLKLFETAIFPPRFGADFTQCATPICGLVFSYSECYKRLLAANNHFTITCIINWKIVRSNFCNIRHPAEFEYKQGSPGHGK